MMNLTLEGDALELASPQPPLVHSSCCAMQTIYNESNTHIHASYFYGRFCKKT
eukprot:CAMPEP_0198694042 /NCGR_PEP_ID=MMETSP1468-20131203/261969_1 /TAXON_ID=1461545 /ORGANISM="Mantoniella sp, Strain CCMP1436" /LENGTH=52 /DNA_ID=CAMNT_0044449007 /DNA_START=13 /DNA_END=167 /DNA_ORIENTATION=+